MKDEARNAMPKRRRVCFVTGTRAEFGLMRRVLETIRDHPQLTLQLIVTGMHLHAEHGRSIDEIRRRGWKIDAAVPWKHSGNNSVELAAQTGRAIAHLAKAYERLKSDIVLVTGDRVEVFAAAAAGHISQRIVAHVHGGDRAAGQIDDSLRHAVSKLAHIHFPATASSNQRLLKLGEDRWRIHQVGSPGIDGIVKDAASIQQVHMKFPKLERHRFALVVLHPVASSEPIEQQRARAVLKAIRRVGIEQSVVIYPNNDPGCRGIIRCWESNASHITYLLKDAPRPLFLGLLRDCAMLVGNSSSGIIEAASFGTPVIDIGPRQQGRERGENVTNVAAGEAPVERAIRKVWNHGRPRRWRGRNPYGGKGTASRIAGVLAGLDLGDPRLKSKLICY
jgi:UDP-hydrolysing UDP-N-acetyl-D-glucosamine 2-epimerase